MIWSILILTIDQRKDLLESLMYKLTQQVVQLSRKTGINYLEKIQLLQDPRGSGVTKGEKRNALLQTAEGKYVCFFDDDDEPAEDYVERIIEALKCEPDCVSLRGIMTTNGANPELFEHSLQYKEWRTTQNKIKYERYPNHLNTIRADIAKRFRFPEIDFGEDHNWSTALHRSGLLKKEYYIDQVLYHYLFRTK